MNVENPKVQSVLNQLSRWKESSYQDDPLEAGAAVFFTMPPTI